MIGADNVLAQGDGRTIKHAKLPLRQENVGNVGARWDGKMSEMSEQSQSKVGKNMVYDSARKSLEC